MSRLSPRETFFLYAAMVGVSLLLFLSGIYVGRSFQAEADGRDPVGDQSRAQADEDPTLDFYSDLKSGDAAAKTPPTEAAGDDSSTDSGEAAQPPAGATPTESTRAAPPPTDRSSRVGETRLRWTVQLGAVKNRGDADQITKRLQAKGYKPILVEPGVDSSDRYFRIWVGELESQGEAQALERRLKRDGFDTFVKRTRFPVG